MKNIKRRPKTAAESLVRTDDAAKRLLFATTSEASDVIGKYGAPDGLTDEMVEKSRDEYGENVLTYGKKNPVVKRLASAFINPFNIVLFVLAVISIFTDIVLAAPEDRSFAAVIIIFSMVTISGILRFVQETRSGNAAASLTQMIHTTATVERNGVRREIPLEELVVGDIIWLSAGDMIPADVRIISAKDLFINQSALTGESEPVERYAVSFAAPDSLTSAENLTFMGSNVIIGSAKAVVLATGNDTMLGAVAKSVGAKPPKTTFEKGVGAVSWILIRFMLVMVPVVLFVNGFTKGDWTQALLFAISVAVGMTPEMLPMIVTTSLAGGALAMGKKKVIVKDLNAIQNLGSIDILCTDKTGTLTEDKVVLEYHLNVDGEEDDRVLRHAFLNSFFQTGLRNLIDIAVIDKQNEKGPEDIIDRYTKVDEIPFDFERRRMTVVVKDKTGKTQMVTKGAVEEMLDCCSFVDCKGGIHPLENETRDYVLRRSDELNDKGMRVIAVAQKTDPSPEGQFSAADEKDMVLIGFLAFLDPPKKSSKDAIKALRDYGVSVKVLTGDNEKVTTAICREVGLDTQHILLGSDVDNMSDKALGDEAEKTTIFAKLSPAGKERVIRVLRERGHSVGYMGDGINDAAAMKASDVGISVDTAVDIAKESAAVVLLEKDLTVLEAGVIEGRKTYANMIKYIKMTASSNFGNMFSVMIASAFLPFLPMASIQLILLNLIYDICCTAVPFDNVDPEYLKVPRKWDASGISRFMLWIGPTSSLFDIITYLVMYFVVCPIFTGGITYSHLTGEAARDFYTAVFQTGWFVESMWTQTLVIHMIRTPKIPFVQSRASTPVTLLTFCGIGLVTMLPFLPFAPALGLTDLPAVYFGWLAVIVAGYMLLATVVKTIYVKRYGELL